MEEGAVKIVCHRIYAHLHDKEFYFLRQLNSQGISRLLEEYNRARFQKKSYSRQDLFGINAYSANNRRYVKELTTHCTRLIF
ncbi:MAG: hypothetical protein AB7D05_08790 [Mangrovibacterium sp.]